MTVRKWLIFACLGGFFALSLSCKKERIPELLVAEDKVQVSYTTWYKEDSDSTNLLMQVFVNGTAALLKPGMELKCNGYQLLPSDYVTSGWYKNSYLIQRAGKSEKNIFEFKNVNGLFRIDSVATPDPINLPNVDSIPASGYVCAWIGTPITKSGETVIISVDFPHSVPSADGPVYSENFVAQSIGDYAVTMNGILQAVSNETSGLGVTRLLKSNPPSSNNIKCAGNISYYYGKRRTVYIHS